MRKKPAVKEKVEGWAMCRRKGAMPFVRAVRDILTLIEAEVSDDRT
jgi:hypothetical protein